MGRWRPPSEKSAPYITATGYRALEDESKSLWKRRREVVKHVAAAAAEGDRSENAEYIYRKKELRGLDRRIGYLQRRMPTLTIVDTVPADCDRVYFGARVEVEDATGTRSRLRIVGSDEIDVRDGCISLDTPFARALMGRSVDAEITVGTNSGDSQYVIVSIDYDEMK